MFIMLCIQLRYKRRDYTQTLLNEKQIIKANSKVRQSLVGPAFFFHKDSSYDND